MDGLELKVGGLYRAKRPQKIGWDEGGPIINDRKIIWMSAFGELQYDGPSVGFGRHYPRTTREKFLKWAGREITAEEWTKPDAPKQLTTPGDAP